MTKTLKQLYNEFDMLIKKANDAISEDMYDFFTDKSIDLRFQIEELEEQIARDDARKDIISRLQMQGASEAGAIKAASVLTDAELDLIVRKFDLYEGYLLAKEILGQKHGLYLPCDVTVTSVDFFK